MTPPPFNQSATLQTVAHSSTHSSFSCCKLVLLIQWVSIQIDHVDSAHSHKGRVHSFSLVAFLHLSRTSCHATSICGCEGISREGETLEITADVSARHHAELQAADDTRSGTSLRAHVVAGRATALLVVLIFKVTKVTWQHVGARARCHYTSKGLIISYAK